MHTRLLLEMEQGPKPAAEAGEANAERRMSGAQAESLTGVFEAAGTCGASAVERRLHGKIITVPSVLAEQQSRRQRAALGRTGAR